MNKFLSKTLLMLAIIFAASNAVSAHNGQIAHFDQTALATMKPDNRQWKSAPKFVQHNRTELKTLGVTLGPTEGYGFITGADGSQWYSTQTYTVKNYYFTSSVITLYNSACEQQASITVNVPDSVQCNQIYLGDVITNNLFDKDKNTLEVPVVLHYILSPGVTAFETRIYDLTSGTEKVSYNGLMSIMQTYTGYSYEYTGVLSYSETVDGVDMTCYGIYSKPGWTSDTAELKNTFSVPTNLAQYQTGSVLNIFNVDNQLHYVITQYEKEYLDPASYEEPWDMIPTANNNFIATIYNKNFKEVGKISIPVTSTKQVLVQYGVGLFGFNDLNKKYWSDADDYELIITSSTFEVTTEKEELFFNVYNTAGANIKSLPSNVKDWMTMYSIPGQNEQIAFLSSDGYSLTMVDMPACDTIISFGATLDGNAISTNIDRYPVNDSYQYVIALADSEVDSNNNRYYKFAWVDKDAKIAHIDKMNVGSNNASWTPLVMGEVFNPYLFDTDSQREYVFIANQYAEGATTGNITDELRIVKTDGTIVAQHKEDPDGHGDLGSCSLHGLDSDTPSFVIPFYSSKTDTYTLEVLHLPLNKFSAGGDGSAQNPYLISSAGDLAMISRDTDAYYKIISDFSASDFGLWSPIASFSGSLNGDNHTISDIMFDGTGDAAGIFANTEGAVIKNLNLQNITMTLDEAGSAGIITANATSDTIININISNATITGSATASVGAIAGIASLNTTIHDCYVSELSISGSDFSEVGGIAGATRTSSSIYNCAVIGNILAASQIGGIAGSTSTGCAVTDCRVECDIRGLNTVGGIVGSADRGGIHRCIAQGLLQATEADWSGCYRIGGIAGSLASAWETPTANVISCNIVNLSEIKTMAGAAHRIVGYSRYEEDKDAAQWDPTLVPEHEAALDSNYVVPVELTSLPTIDAEIAAGANTTEGADLAADEYNQSFLEKLGFKFGNDSQNPWVENGMFKLYLEGDFNSIESVVENKPEITFDNNTIVANGAVAIEAYHLSGTKVASGVSTIDTANLTKGVYIIVATDATGAKKTAKIVIK